MTAGASEPGRIHLQIIEVMKRFPEGISGGQIRQELEKEGLRPENQIHLDRRKRDLKKWFVIDKAKATVIVDGKRRHVTLYIYKGKKPHATDEGPVSQNVEPKSFIPLAAAVRCAAGRSRRTLLPWW